MEGSSLAVNGGSSFSPPRKAPPGLTIASFLPFAKPHPVSSPVKRKPLPPNAQLSPRSSSQQIQSVNILNGNIDSVAKSTLSPELVVRDLDLYPRGNTPLIPTGPGLSNANTISQPETNAAQGNDDNSTPQAIESGVVASQPSTEQPGLPRRSTSMASKALTGPPPRPDVLVRSFTTNSLDTKAPKTPGNKIIGFFGWKSSSPGGDSSSTEISDGRSPLPSPMLTSPQTPQTTAYSSRSLPPAIDITKANSAMMLDPNSHTPGYMGSAPLTDPELMTKISLLEAELREISAELAGSIKREMELEDMVEEMQLENAQTPAPAHRTSDYYSDSSSSFRYGNEAPKPDDLERVKRQSAQERAQLKVSLSQKWQDERSKRKALESHVSLLEEQVSQSRRENTNISSLNSKAKELETSLEDARRRLTEERQIKENFEDLLTALRVDLEQHRNERDNLRDHVVPDLKAQLVNASTSQANEFDFQRMQQEIQALRKENATLANARKMQADMQQNAARFNTIVEEEDAPKPRVEPRVAVGLTRSNSLARAPARSGTGLARSNSLSRQGSLSRSNSVSGKTQESRDALVERVKDVEAQRDALHQAVKSLLDRQAYQTREHEKRVRQLEVERERALDNSSPRRQGFENEVRTLREEINHLRRRADEAMEQKWQTEKGLGGLKMDLERAEQETSSLRNLLQEHDVNVPEQLSSSLQEAYSELQQERQQIETQMSSARSLEEERRLAEQLQESAERSEALAAQVRQQLYTNQNLRDRLTTAIERGERDQQVSASKITTLQAKLRKLEDTMVLAQQQSETAVMKHEADVRYLNEGQNSQLHRTKNGLRTPTRFSPTSPMFPARSPRLAQTTSGPGMALGESLKMEYLESKVKSLEKALLDADADMGEVLGKMNNAQFEVADLQGERDEALRQTRRLQAEIMAEREKVKAMFA